MSFNNIDSSINSKTKLIREEKKKEKTPELLIENLIIRAHGSFTLFPDCLIAETPIRAKFEDGKLCIYNANRYLPLTSISATAPTASSSSFQINNNNNNNNIKSTSSFSSEPSIGTSNGALLPISTSSLEIIPTKTLPIQSNKKTIEKNNKETSLLFEHNSNDDDDNDDYNENNEQNKNSEDYKVRKKQKQKQIELIDTSKKTIVIEGICYSLALAPLECQALERKKVLVPYWKLNNDNNNNNNSNKPKLSISHSFMTSSNSSNPDSGNNTPGSEKELSINSSSSLSYFGSPKLNRSKTVISSKTIDPLLPKLNRAPSLPSLPDLYEADDVEYTRWKLTSGALEGATVLIPSCYQDETSRELLYDEGLIYRPRPRNPTKILNATNENTNTNTNTNNNIGQLLSSRKRRCSITDIDQTSSYSFINNPRCKFRFNNIEIAPPSSENNGNRVLATIVHLYLDKDYQMDKSALLPNTKIPLTVIVRGLSTVRWNLPISNFWPDHFSMYLYVHDEASVHFQGILYQAYIETRNTSKVLNLNAYEYKHIRAYHSSIIKGQGEKLCKLESFNSSFIDVKQKTIELPIE